MTLAGVGVLCVILGVVLLISVPWRPRLTVRLLDLLALTLAAFGLMWTSTLLVPPGGSHLVSTLGVVLLAVQRARQKPEPPLLELMIGVFLGAVGVHFSFALLDMALSTQTFSSDLELLQAGWVRSWSAARILVTAGQATPMAIGACLGHWIVRKRWQPELTR